MRDRQTSYFTVFGESADGSWRVLMDELELPGEVKYEGIEVLSWIWCVAWRCAVRRVCAGVCASVCARARACA